MCRFMSAPRSRSEVRNASRELQNEIEYGNEKSDYELQELEQKPHYDLQKLHSVHYTLPIHEFPMCPHYIPTAPPKCAKSARTPARFCCHSTVSCVASSTVIEGIPMEASQPSTSPETS